MCFETLFADICLLNLVYDAFAAAIVVLHACFRLAVSLNMRTLRASVSESVFSEVCIVNAESPCWRRGRCLYWALRMRGCFLKPCFRGMPFAF